MTFHAGDRVFVDESKTRGYWITATATAPAVMPENDKRLRQLLKPGQRRLHFTKESPQRRRALLSAMVDLDARVAVFSISGVRDTYARPACLRALVQHAVRDDIQEVVLERDDSLSVHDRRVIAAAIRTHQTRTEFRYRHASPHEFPLLWVSDAVAWSYAKGGDWRRRAAPLVGDRHYRL
ncbi:hypothetical protein [Demequina aestuarii]|uniref:hypothetical protein n=1 Tax=Demequina aestuarii TaxID=327095 RepID=UPI000783E91B|nr:hypothetical protein [Demequina aestuarii]